MKYFNMRLKMYPKVFMLLSPQEQNNKKPTRNLTKNGRKGEGTVYVTRPIEFLYSMVERSWR